MVRSFPFVKCFVNMEVDANPALDRGVVEVNLRTGQRVRTTDRKRQLTVRLMSSPISLKTLMSLQALI